MNSADKNACNVETSLDALSMQIYQFFLKIYEPRQTIPAINPECAAQKDEIIINQRPSLNDILLADLLSRPQYVIVNNVDKQIIYKDDKDEKEEQEKKDQTNKLIAMVLTAGVSFLGVHVLAKDEYMSFMSTKINKRYKNFKNLFINNSESDELISNIIISYNSWHKSFKKRTLRKLYSKFGLFTSLLLFSGGYCYHPVIMNIGFCGSVISASYLFYRHLTDDLQYEKAKFIKLINNMDALKTSIYYQKHQMYPDLQG